MIRILIIEDEKPAAQRLQKILQQIGEEFELIAHLESIEDSIKWFKKNTAPDLVFLDIELADGNSFGIFKEVKVLCPIIFITAYNQYAIDAFKVNSIDYLLKPIKKEDLEYALQKFHATTRRSEPDYSALLKNLVNKEYQKRIVVRYADVIKTVDIENIAFFYTEEKYTFLFTFDNQKYPIDYTLDQIDHMVDPQKYFRINRQVIINFKAIEKMIAYSKARVKLILKPLPAFETVVSTERSPYFKEWLLGFPNTMRIDK
ncbi:MAG TPA: DNA-binding response regulator [Bacteroidetes bacterium]|nr:DNA-binding response regulator [Bacteroidota bacterium]